MANSSYLNKSIKNMLGAVDVKIIFLMVLFTISIAWIPDALTELLKLYFSEEKFPFLQPLVMILASVGILTYLYWIAKKNASSDFDDTTEIHKIVPVECKVLIIFLSSFFNERFNKDLLNSTDLEEFKSINLYMPLRAVKFHSSRLEYLQVICSSKTKDEFDKFQTIVENIFGKNFKIEKIDSNLDFENLDDIQTILKETYKKAFSIGKKQQEIMIDITGGQKMVSIAGSYYCLANERIFQYVSTTNQEVAQYNNKRRVD